MTENMQIQFPIDNIPMTCIYNVDHDYYSQFYDIEKSCQCGKGEWFLTMLEINTGIKDLILSPKRIHRCSACKNVRKCNMKKEYINIINLSENCLNAFINIFKKTKGTEYELLCTLKNMVANVEREMNCREINMIEKDNCIQNHFDMNKVDKNMLVDMIKEISNEKVYQYH